MAIGTNWTGEARAHTDVVTNDYAVLVSNASAPSLTTTTYGEITAASILDTNLYQCGYMKQEVIKAMIAGDKKENIGYGNQEINISQMHSLEWEMPQANSFDAKAQQEIEDSELVLYVVKQDAIVVDTATLEDNGTISSGNVVAIFDKCFVQVSVEDAGGENKKARFSMKKSNLPVKYSYLGEGIGLTLTS